MSLESKIPVPEVDELRVARMEREIVGQVSRMQRQGPVSGSGWAKIGVGVLAVAGVLLAIALNLRGAQGPGTQPRTDAPLPTRLATGPGESDRLLLGDAVVDVEENTDISVQRFVDGRTLIVLQKGSVHCEVEPRENRPVFQVRAGDVEVTVIGTAFDVKRDLTVEVTVERGIVGVSTSHETLRLHAGESWQGSPNAGRSLASLLEEEHRSNAAVDEKTTEIVDAGPSASVAANAVDSQHRRDAGSRKHKQDRGNKTVPLREVLKSAKPIRPVVQPSHGAEARKLLAIASSNPAKAVRQLEALGATSTGHEASFALYSRAYLLFFELGQRREVVEAAMQYARRFPRGREAEDMLWLRVRASCDDANYSSDCRSAAHTYQRRYPQGVFQGLASKLIRSKPTE